MIVTVAVQTVEKFITQFSWVTKLGEILINLSDAGHFRYYPEFFIEISVAESPNTIKNRYGSATYITNRLNNIIIFMFGKGVGLGEGIK